MTRPSIAVFAVAVLGLPSILAPKQATVNSQRPLPTAVRAARLLDVKNGNLINNAVVLVDGDRITAVGSALPIPPGVNVIDLEDMTLLPGSYWVGRIGLVRSNRESLRTSLPSEAIRSLRLKSWSR